MTQNTRKTLKFSDLKSKYKDIDLIKDDETRIIIGDFIISSDGKITISRSSYTMEGVYCSIFTYVTKKATVEQMDLFIEMIKEN